VSTTCRLCGGAVEGTVLSGIVSLKRRRSMMASGRVSSLRAETCTVCGHTELFADRPERLFPEIPRETSGN
jgi:hypothetical protein